MYMTITVLELFQISRQKTYGSAALLTAEGGAKRRTVRRRRAAPPVRPPRPTARKSLSAEGAIGWAYNARAYNAGAKIETTRIRMFSARERETRSTATTRRVQNQKYPKNSKISFSMNSL